MSGGTQLPLGFSAPSQQRLSNFVAGADSAVLEAVSAVARGQSSEWLCLVGPAGSGKTHLLVGACHEAAAAGAQYLPLARLGLGAEDALTALVPRALIAIDDLDAIAGHLGAEIALFDVYNRMRETGGRMLFAARHRPGLLNLALPDLVSRLSACTHLALTPLDDADRRRVFVARANERGLEIDPEVVDFLFRRHVRDLGALLALLERIDRESLVAQRRITVPFLRRLVGLPGRDS